MSNHLAIAAVTSALRLLVQEVVNENGAGGTNVFTKRPANSMLDGEQQVTIYLYQVTPNVTWRNDDLPTRRADGTPLRRPQVALDLSYLISFYGNDEQLVPQQQLGRVVAALHAQPLLSSRAIRDVLKGDLTKSDLADQIERVRFSLQSLSLEEFSKLWSVFFQVPYALSLAYQASVVLIEAEAPRPAPAPPVQRAVLLALPLRQPTIESVEPAVVEPGDTLVIRGRQLASEQIKLLIQGRTFLAEGGSDTRVALALPSDLRAGTSSVQVVHPPQGDTQIGAYRGFESNAGVFVLRPRVEGVEVQQSEAGERELVVTIAPPVAEGQRVALLLNRADPPVGQRARGYQLDAPPGLIGNELRFALGDVAAGNYLVRVRVDNAESAPYSDRARVSIP